jgi:long-chain fatty acid transport protein
MTDPGFSQGGSTMKAVQLGRLVATIAVLLIPRSAPAAGYAIYEQGAAALGMAGVGTASIHDASAVFFNPAALVRLDGTHLYAGGSVLTPVTSFAGVAPYPGYGVTEEMNRRQYYPPTVYATHRLPGRWAIGAGLNSPFGLGVDWKNPDAFSGRYIVTRATLHTLNAGLVAACALDPRWSVALGADAMFANVDLENRILQPYPGGGGAQVDVAKAKLAGDYTAGYGWNAAVSFVPDPRWKLGAFYRGKVIVDIDGSADFTQIPTDDASFDAGVAAALPPDQPLGAVLRFPATWSAGVAFSPVPEWTIETDVNFVEWSLFRDLPIRFSRTPSANQTLVEDYSDSWQVRAGAEHRLPRWTYRFGYYFDRAAAPDASVTPLLPDADRHGISLGVGIPFGPEGRWRVDAYELALLVKRRDTMGVERDGFDGEYKSFVNLAGFGVAYHW